MTINISIFEQNDFGAQAGGVVRRHMRFQPRRVIIESPLAALMRAGKQCNPLRTEMEPIDIDDLHGKAKVCLACHK